MERLGLYRHRYADLVLQSNAAAEFRSLDGVVATLRSASAMSKISSPNGA